jgi:hypothetical protein
MILQATGDRTAMGRTSIAIRLLVVVIVGWAAPAHAGHRVGLLLNGNSTKFALIEAHFGEWLRAHGEVLGFPSIAAASMISKIADCFVRENLDCARALVEATEKANTLLYVDVAETAGMPPDLAFTAYWFERGQDVLVARGSCQGCTTASLRSTTDVIMTRLVRVAKRQKAIRIPESVRPSHGAPAKRPVAARSQSALVTTPAGSAGTKRVGEPTSVQSRRGSASIVLEVHDGQRSKDAGRLGPFLDEMERLGFDARPDSIRARFRGRLPRLGSDPSKKPADAERLQDYALSVWKRQPPAKELLPPLKQAVTETFDNAAFLIADPNRREPLRRLLIALALTYQRIGDIENAEAIEMELIRSYPNQAVTETQDGPDAAEFYEKVRTSSLALGRGTLTVVVKDPSLQVYIDETARRSNVPNADLVPGPYRVVVIDVNKHARRYDIDVLRSQDSVLDVDWDADSAFVYTGDSAALIFQTRSARVRDAELARRLLRSFDNSTVTLISISRSSGTVADAAHYSTQSGRLLRHAQTKLGTKDEQSRLFALARFVAKGIESPDVIVLDK